MEGNDMYLFGNTYSTLFYNRGLCLELQKVLKEMEERFSYHYQGFSEIFNKALLPFHQISNSMRAWNHLFPLIYKTF